MRFIKHPSIIQTATLILSAAISTFIPFAYAKNQMGTHNASVIATKEPNIIVIVADDQGYADLGIAGLANDVVTPNLDRIAHAGVRFTQGYVTSPICSTSRLGLITGTYTQRTGGYYYGEGGAISPKLTTIAEMLKSQNYATGYIGKYHYGFYQQASRDFPMNHGFDRFYGSAGSYGRKHYLIHDDAKNDAFIAKMKKHQRQGQTLAMNSMWDNREKVTPTGFATEIYGAKAREYIRENKSQKFYLQVAFNAIHNFTHQLPAAYLKQHKLNTIEDWDPAKEEYYHWLKKGRYPNNPQGRAYYLAQLSLMDKEIGKLLDTVATEGLTDNTIIIYLSDNGGATPIYANNTPLRGGKYLLNEGGIRVPMMIAWPTVFSQNIVVDNVISTMDLMPTLATITGSSPHKHIDGQDISALLTGKKTNIAHKTLVWDTGNSTAVRHGKWKLLTAIDDKDANYNMVKMKLGTFLYDLEKDPSESINLSKKHPEIVAELQQIYLAWKSDINQGI
jgi:arylsulfatase A-like enzyme